MNQMNASLALVIVISLLVGHVTCGNNHHHYSKLKVKTTMERLSHEDMDVAGRKMSMKGHLREHTGMDGQRKMSMLREETVANELFSDIIEDKEKLSKEYGHGIHLKPLNGKMQRSVDNVVVTEKHHKEQDATSHNAVMGIHMKETEMSKDTRHADHNEFQESNDHWNTMKGDHTSHRRLEDDNPQHASHHAGGECGRTSTKDVYLNAPHRHGMDEYVIRDAAEYYDVTCIDCHNCENPVGKQLYRIEIKITPRPDGTHHEQQILRAYNKCFGLFKVTYLTAHCGQVFLDGDVDADDLEKVNQIELSKPCWKGDIYSLEVVAGTENPSAKCVLGDTVYFHKNVIFYENQCRANFRVCEVAARPGSDADIDLHKKHLNSIKMGRAMHLASEKLDVIDDRDIDQNMDHGMDHRRDKRKRNMMMAKTTTIT